MVPSSLAEMKTSLKGWVARPQIPPWVCPLIIVLDAAFFSPTSMISPSLVPTRILPWISMDETDESGSVRFSRFQDTTKHKHQQRSKARTEPGCCGFMVGSYLPSADGSDVLHRLTSLQLKHSAALHLLIPQFHSPALFSPVNHTRSIVVWIYCSLIKKYSNSAFCCYNRNQWWYRSNHLPLGTAPPSTSGSCSGHNK